MRRDTYPGSGVIGSTIRVTHPRTWARGELISRESLGVADVLFENMPLLSPLSYTPIDTFYGPSSQPGVPSYPGQWNLDRIKVTGPGRTAFDYVLDVLDDARPRPTIAILDCGCDLNHCDLVFVPGSGGQALNGADTTVPTFHLGHGTMCAGVAAGSSSNFKGVASVAGFLTRVMPLAFTNVTDMEAAQLIGFAVANGARVINMSWNTTFSGSTTVTDAALDNAYNRNVVLCASAGNSTAGGSVVVAYPGTHPKVIACGSTDRADNRAPDSKVGDSLSVCAPGVDIPTTTRRGLGTLFDVNGQDWVHNFNGTSAAAPHVAGLAILLLNMDPTLTPDEIRAIIEGTAARVPTFVNPRASANGPRNLFVGHGRINALDAVLANLPTRLRR